jgi:hypothetical protein
MSQIAEQAGGTLGLAAPLVARVMELWLNSGVPATEVAAAPGTASRSC